LSGFTKLKSLAVLDIDTLDIVSELQSCLRNSAGTLSKLKLSFSDKLAASARKPQIDPDPEDSDQEDDIMPMPGPSHTQIEEMSGPARAFRAQEERKTQETVLGRIFGVESTTLEKLQGAIVVVEVEKKKSKVKTEQELVDFMKTLATKFMGELNGTRDHAASQEIVDMIGAAAQKYIAEVKSQKDKEDEKSNTAEPSSSSASQPSDDKAVETPAESSEPAVSLFSETATPNKAKESQGNVSPEDIDIEEPEEQLAIDSEELPASEADVNEPAGASEGTTADAPEDAPTDAPAPTATPALTAAAVANTKAEFGKVLAALESQKEDYMSLVEEFESQGNALTKDIQGWRANNSPIDLPSISAAESQLLNLTQRIRDMQKEITTCRLAIEGAETSLHHAKDHVRHMRDYIRETRGVALESFSVHLIPVKASVLSRAVDLRVLRRLTLLNVGIQAPNWALLQRENAEAPLPLRKIFTDNVSIVFLNFVASLPELHELFLLERENKSKPESFAPRTQTTIDQIRRLVLKKHLPTLRRLMIKNLADVTWDMNDKAILLLCRQGKQLEELACNMSVRAVVCPLRPSL
jgi:hypothetical protein